MAELAAQGMRERNDAMRAPPPRRIVRQERHELAHQAARLGEELAPLLAALPPTFVARVVAEPEKDRQRQPEKRERRGGCVTEVVSRR